jgi:hypothetical protein
MHQCLLLVQGGRTLLLVAKPSTMPQPTTIQFKGAASCWLLWITSPALG